MPHPHIKRAYVRVAQSKELDTVCKLMHKAFADDPVFTYFGSVRNTEASETEIRVQRNLARFTKFVPALCQNLGGRITVAVIPGDSASDKETIAAAAVWYPPNCRPSLWKALSLVSSGVIPVLAGWGFTGLMRVGFEYLDGSEHCFKQCWKEGGRIESPNDSWYLNLVGTDPEYQNQGLMSLLIREAFAFAPESTFTLEATTSKSRDQYTHLGFQLLTEMRLGKGKVGGLGYPASSETAVGVPLGIMATPPRRP